MKIIQEKFGAVPYEVEGIAVYDGLDIAITIGGGTKYHIGATAIAHFHPSLKNTSSGTASVSVVSVPGHKEDQLVRNTAIKFANEIRCTVVVNAGMHIEQATREDIDKLCENYEQLTDLLLRNILIDRSNKL